MITADSPKTRLAWYQAKKAEAAKAAQHAHPAKVNSDNARFLLRVAYKRLGTWDAVAQWYGEHSKATYYRMVTDQAFYPSQELVDHIERRELPPIHRTVAIPDKHDAAVYLTPDGDGTLTTHTVPDDAQVAIIPPGARIIPPSPRKRPPYKRPTWAMVRALQAEIDRLQTELDQRPSGQAGTWQE